MARVIWSGALAFGLVNIPIGLYAATEDRTVHFNQFQKGTSDRIRYKRVNERTGEEVPFKEIVKGREVDDDTYVLVTDEELESVEPGRTRTIDITDFVDLSEVDPIYFQKTYYLAPRGDGADRSYELLHQAMAATNRVGIATLVMRSKEYLVAVRPQEKILALETMYFADEIRDPIEATGYEPTGRAAKPREVTIARQLIESMTTDWDPEQYHDSYRERVEELIESKRNGEEIEAAAPAPKASKVVDLTEMLRQSVEQAKGRGTRGSKTTSSTKSTTSPRSTSSNTSGTTQRSSRQSQPSRKARPAQDVPDLSEMSKTQLAQLAGELEIAGRSKMTRDDLEQAIRRARRPKAVS
jgi:DNA end-binding protein Ku